MIARIKLHSKSRTNYSGEQLSRINFLQITLCIVRKSEHLNIITCICDTALTYKIGGLCSNGDKSIGLLVTNAETVSVLTHNSVIMNRMKRVLLFEKLTTYTYYVKIIVII